MDDLAEHLTLLDDGSIEVDFKDCPLTIDGGEVTSLKLREPTVKDQMNGRKAGKNDPAVSEVAILASLSEQAPDTIEGLKLRQYGRLQDAYAAFIG